MAKFQIFTDSCSDLTLEQRKQLNIDYFHMGLVVDGVEKTADLDWIEYSPEEFYGWLSSGKKIKTTQVSSVEFKNKMTPYLEKGIDILYIGCSSALSGSVNFFQLAKEDLLEIYPERKMICIDSLAGAFTEGFIVYKAAELQAEGKNIDEVAQWVEDHKFNFNQFATVETLNYLRDAGRIKGAKAFFGNIMSVKPIFISDRHGNNFVISKTRGTKASIDALFEGVKEVYEKGKDGIDKVFIGQGMAQENAQILKKKLLDELNIEAEIIWIGPIVGTTCGPGVLGVFAYGKEVTRFEGDGK